MADDALGRLHEVLDSPLHFEDRTREFTDAFADYLEVVEEVKKARARFRRIGRHVRDLETEARSRLKQADLLRPRQLIRIAEAEAELFAQETMGALLLEKEIRNPAK